MKSVLFFCACFRAALGMQCPYCGEYRAKKQWTKGQWAARSACVNGYVGCRSCLDAGPRENFAPGHSRGDCSDLRLQVAVGLATCLSELCYHLAQIPDASDRWDALVWDWGNDVLRQTRKDLSRYGALPCTFAWEPKHWNQSVPGVAGATAGCKHGRLTCRRPKSNVS